MGILEWLKQRSTWGEAVGFLGTLLKDAVTADQWREQIINAAQRGDLDAPFFRLKAAAGKAKTYVKKG